MMRTDACVYPCSSGLCYCFRREPGCCLSLPVLAFLLSGRRATFPRTWRVLYFLLLLAQVVLLCWQPWLWLNGESVSGIGLALVVADIVALIWLLTNRRLRACFNEVKE